MGVSQKLRTFPDIVNRWVTPDKHTDIVTHGGGCERNLKFFKVLTNTPTKKYTNFSFTYLQLETLIEFYKMEKGTLLMN